MLVFRPSVTCLIHFFPLALLFNFYLSEPVKEWKKVKLFHFFGQPYASPVDLFAQRHEEGMFGPLRFQHFTTKGGSCRAKKSRKVLMMMMKAAKLGLAGAGAGLEQRKSGAEA